jgi:hypothetical protein
MTGVLDILILVGGLVAGAIVALVCVVGLMVWLAGGPREPSAEAWRPDDKR